MYNISIEVNISKVYVYLRIGIVRFPMLINALLIVIGSFKIYLQRNISKRHVKVDK